MKFPRPFAFSPAIQPARLIVAITAFWAMAAISEGGDILRGGATAAKKRPGETQGSSGAAAAERARAVAKDRLAKTSQALQSVRAMQTAARAAASRPIADPNRPGFQLPTVPNGLGPGGLDIIGTPTGAGSPTQSGTTVTIKQSAQQAILNWKTFNVGAKTKLVFDQSKGGSQSGQWIAFNKVTDPSGSPSQILGSIKAQGQVYVINQNGIIFGSGSQVNVHTLVASALPINDNLVTGGLLNNPDSQFLFSALPIAAGSKGTAAFTPPPPLTPSGKTGDVTVMRGAEITVPTNSSKTGGRVMLVGPNVTNAGTISTPDGQTILAAGLQVGIDAHSSKDPSLRGLDVFVGAIADPSSTLAPYAGTAVNSGIIDAPRGNITLTGKSIKQLGILNSTTSVSLNGRIDLLASYDAVPNPAFDAANAANGLRFIYKKAGSILLGEGSVIQVLPEIWSTEVAVGTQLTQRSQINLQGYTIHFAPDSIVLAPNANVAVKAGIWKFIDSGAQSKSQFLYSAGQIYVDNGAVIDVAGTTGVTVPLAQSILTLQLRGAELSDAPLQRDELLRAILLTVDIRNTGTYNGQFWVGTPLGDATGYVNLIERLVAQLTTAGGNVDFKAGGSVVLREGSTIDVSGGWTQSDGGPVQTTRVLYRGNLIDIADATPDRLYSGIYTGETTEVHAKWGILTKYAHALAMTGAYNERGQVSGADGGSISITAPAMALDGTLTGQTVEGPRQVRSSLTSSMLPKPASLNLAFRGQEDLAPDFRITYPDALEVIFREGMKQAQVADFSLDAAGNPEDLDDERKKTVYLSPKLLEEGGFGGLTVSNEIGIISVPLGVSVRTKAGGALSLTASNIDIQGSLLSPGGSIKLQALNISPYDAAVNSQSSTPVILPPNPGRGIVTLGASAVVSAAGLIVDDRPTSDTAFSQPIVIHGGSVDIDAYSASLAEGSIIDASGGVVFSAIGEKVYGNGGSIAIRTGQDPLSKEVLGGILELGSQLRGYSGAIGGSLTLQTQLMQIGGSAADERTFVIQPEFFNRGGFGSFTLAGLGAQGDEPGEYVPAVTIAPGTVIAPHSQSLVAMPFTEGGKGIGMRVADKPVGLRTPVSLHFSAPGVSFGSDKLVRGDIVMGEGSLIVTDPLGEVSLKGDTVAVLGSIYAPGGSIEISGASDSRKLFADPTVARTTVYIGSNSVLSAAGATLYTPDSYGRRIGEVLAGGLISISGNIVASEGAVLDVSGASAILDVHPSEINPLSSYSVPVNSGITSQLYQLGSVPVRVDSDGGAIILKGGQMLYSDATLRGFAGGPTALGGALIVSSGRFYLDGAIPSDLDPNLVVKQGGNVIGSALPNSVDAIGMSVRSADGLPSDGQGYFSVEKFEQGGFDILALKGKVDFRGEINITARQGIMVADGGILYADSTVKLTAPYVALGMAFPDPTAPEDADPPFPNGENEFNYPPTFGPGRLIVNASLIDVGTLLLRNIGFASLSAPNGDIRGSGIFNIAGDLVLTAAQIYPVTASTFSITAYDRNIQLAASTQGSTTVTLASTVLPQGFGIGSPLLGSVVKSINGTEVILETGANATVSNSWLSYAPGSVTIIGSGTRSLPLSAGGTLNIYASIINQGGVLRAPFGAINIGWDGTGTAPVDLLTGTTMAFPVTQQLNLRSGSVTSVSAIDPITGEGSLIPYGLLLNGTSWIDPRGVDISAGGIPGKTISIAATNLSVDAGSIIDIRGGGDLYAYRWVRGNGGTNDILGSASGKFSPTGTYGAGTLVSYGGKTWSARVDLDSSGFLNGIPTPEIGSYWNFVPESYAVIPGYDANYAPFAPFNSNSSNFNGDPGYVSSLSIGDRIYLGASNGLAAGTYTLLPARYALLPGAFLVTPQKGRASGTIVMADGSSVVSGYRYNDLNTSRAVPTLSTRFEVASASVFRQRAEYEDYFANSFLSESATSLGVKVPRLPMDAGHLVLQATQSMALLGDVLAWGAPGGRGGWVDIASTSDILIGGKGATGGAGQLVLDASHLSKFGAESLLIGGVRTETADGVHVNVLAGNITVDNAGSPLTAPDVILLAKGNLVLEDGAQVIASGSLGGPADTLYIGDSDPATTGSGNGTLLRVSASPFAEIVRSDVSNSTAPHMVIGANALISGASLTLDSTYATTLDPTADLLASVISLNSGQISIQLDNSGALQPTVGLVLGGEVLADVRGARSLSLLSYSSIDIYGTGVFDMAGSLALHASTIRGYNNGGGTVTFDAKNITLDNKPGRPAATFGAASEGTLEFNAQTIRLGEGQLAVGQYSNLSLNAARGLFLSGTGGLSIAQGALTATTPFLSAASQSTYTVKAGGLVSFQAPTDSDVKTVPSGLGASLTIEGASVNVTSDIRLPSGLLTLHASTGDVSVGGLLDVGGTAQTFYDVIKYTNAGQVRLMADAGSVQVADTAIISVAAHEDGGDAGTLGISTPQGTFTLDGTLIAQAGEGYKSGSFVLDTGSLPELGSLNQLLNNAAFNESRSIRVRNGDVLVDGIAKSHIFDLSADRGSITVSGTVDASGVTGGTINLQAHGNVTLLDGSLLTVAAENFSSAGKGGEVFLSSGTSLDGIAGTGYVDIQTGSTIDLSVASKVAGSATTPGTSAWQGQFSGKLHVRAPQNATGTDLLVQSINGTIIDASSIVVEGYRLYEVTGTAGTVTTAIQNSINSDGQSFLGAAGTTSTSYTAMTSRLLANNAGLESVFVLAPGAEIFNRTGNVTLGSASSTYTSDWDLSTFRYGAKRAAGVLTIRAKGDLVFYNALSDGFTPLSSATSGQALWLARPMAYNALLPANAQSWSYNLTAGADLSAAGLGQVLPLSQLGTTSGSLKLGKPSATTSTTTGSTASLIGSTSSNLYQVIRTGSGDININTGRSVQLLNQLATIYTAGTRVADATMGGVFDNPSLLNQNQNSGGVLGPVQQEYIASYTMAGGNVSIKAGQNIEHLAGTASQLVADSQLQMPNNWLYRRGSVDSATGEFNVSPFGDAESTTWWVNFSNFFQGVGALGGGNVTMIAGSDISNVDAVIPTNARMPGKVAGSPPGNPDTIAPNASNLLELGGGDLVVRAGNNIDAGVYYVERGHGTLDAGGEIKTNSTRAVNRGSSAAGDVLDSSTWLPTTLFVGKGGFDVGARGNVLLGPAANTFLLPGGLSNSFWYKTYFSTYAPDSYVNVTSLGGDVTLRTGINDGSVGLAPSLYLWARQQQLYTAGLNNSASAKPWLQLSENNVSQFITVSSLLPPTIKATSFSRNINLAGDLTLFPAPRGTIELLAAEGINGLQPTGSNLISANTRVTYWASSVINVSDANPAAIPGIANPYAYQAYLGYDPRKTVPPMPSASTVAASNGTFLQFISELFRESGSTEGIYGSSETKQALHTPGLLHLNDPNPTRIYAKKGDISGFTFFSPKPAQVFAGRDISDIAFYLQNLEGEDVSIVTSGRDIIPYNANTPLRALANSAGNLPNNIGGPRAGDVQINGPGMLEVLAGRNLDLGTGGAVADGTGTGITSIGNARNVYLGFEGADIIAVAGIGSSKGLAASALDFDRFASEYLDDANVAAYLAEIGVESGTSLEDLSAEQRSALALKVFFLVLRDTGRDFNDPDSAGFQNYDSGYAAIAALLGNGKWRGDINTRGRDIRTKSGGDITVMAPGGSLTLATSVIGRPPVPPGIVTEGGGSISIFTEGDVNIGISRIFTLRGGDLAIWSTSGDIAAGSSSKTVKSAPPTRVLIDPQSADVTTDLAGLATGGGIGVLATVADVPPGNVDLIAPQGTIDAGDAGIRATGTVVLAANEVLNADNITASQTVGAPPAAAPPAASNISGLTAGSSAAGAASSAMESVTDNAADQAQLQDLAPSIITVEVLGYGGGDGEDEEQF